MTLNLQWNQSEPVQLRRDLFRASLNLVALCFEQALPGTE